MVLEATMICIDISVWMRKRDYSPSRLQAQMEAVNLLCGAKTQSNPEKTMGTGLIKEEDDARISEELKWRSKILHAVAQQRESLFTWFLHMIVAGDKMAQHRLHGTLRATS